MALLTDSVGVFPKIFRDFTPKNMVTAPVRGRAFMFIAFAPMKSIASKTQGFCTFWLKSIMNLENKTL